MKTVVSKNQTYLFRQLPNPIAVVNANGEVVLVSDQWLDFFDMVWDNTIGAPINAIFSNIHPEVTSYVSKCMDHPGNYSFTSQNPHSKDTLIKFLVKPWYDTNENPTGTIIEAQYHTRQIQMEEKLESFDALLHGLSTITNVGIWEYNFQNQKLYWSKMTKKIHEVGADFEPEIDTAIGFYKQGYSQNTIAMLVHNALENKTPFKECLQIITQKGKERWVIAAGQPYFKNGEAIRLVGTIQDVTDEIETENKIKDSAQLLQTLMDNLPLNIYVKDKDSRKILVNKSECDYLGAADPEELIGHSDFDLYDKHIAQISRDEDVEVMKTLTPMLGRETVNIRKDGSTTTFLTSKIPLLNTYGEANGIIGISMDITEMKNKENELHDLINVTAIQNKKLINFAHIVSHNLRSHTSNFTMLLKFLIEEKDENEKSRIIKMLTEASNNLTDTLDDLNQVVEINANVNIEKEEVNVKHLIDRVATNLWAFLRKNKAVLDYETLNDKASVNAVPAYLDSILMNLFTNAVKYKHPDRDPKIQITFSKNKNVSMISVKDNGLGIDLDKHENKLFGMYKTFHHHKDARGIGLYISKNQIEAMGGKIFVESKVGHGSTFKIHLYERE